MLNNKKLVARILIPLVILSILSLIFIIFIHVQNASSNQSENTNIAKKKDDPTSTVSYPDPSQLGTELLAFEKNEWGFSLEYPNNISNINEAKKSEVDNDFYKLTNVVVFKNPKSARLKDYLRVAPIKASNSKSALNLLEMFIVSKVGGITKSDQITGVINNYNFAQIGYKLDLAEDIFDIFIAIKDGDRGWILRPSIDSLKEYTNAFDYSSKSQNNKVFKLLESINLNTNFDINEFNELSTPTSFMVEYYKESNKDLFESTIY